jgi:Flp pilus assembly protein CpaB
LRNRKFIIFLVLTLVFAAVSAVQIAKAVRSYTPVVRFEETVQVVIVTEDTPPYTPIEKVKKIEYPQSLVPVDAITDPEEVIGKTAQTLLLADTIVRKGHLTDTAIENIPVALLTALDDPEMRGIPISIPAGFSSVKPNDLINIVQVSPGKAETIYENIPVLHVDEKAGYMLLPLSREKIEVLLALGDSIRWYYSPYGAVDTIVEEEHVEDAADTKTAVEAIDEKDMEN